MARTLLLRGMLGLFGRRCRLIGEFRRELRRGIRGERDALAAGVLFEFGEICPIYQEREQLAEIAVRFDFIVGLIRDCFGNFCLAGGFVRRQFGQFGLLFLFGDGDQRGEDGIGVCFRCRVAVHASVDQRGQVGRGEPER